MTDAPTATPAPTGSAAQRRGTPRPGDFAAKAPVHTPSVLAVSERCRAERWKTFSLVVTFSALVTAWLAIRAGRTADSIYVMDPLGNVYAGPVEPLADSRRFFNVSAIYATNAALQRSSAGFDVAELIKLYYTPRAVAKLDADQKRRAADMRRRSLQWKPLIETISAPVNAGGSRIVEVRGRVVMAGAFASRTFIHEPPFTLVLTFIRNPDIGKVAAYPWVADDVDLKLETGERGK